MPYSNNNNPTHNYKMNTKILKGFSYELGPIRPPSEGQDRSLLVRATINCPWNRCLFCRTYRNQKFVYRKVEEIKNDIDIAKGLHDALNAASLNIGHNGNVDNETLMALINGNPEIYSEKHVGPIELQSRLQSLLNMANWMASGARTVFLQDANSLIMKTDDLIEILHYLKQEFPTIERITSYARSQTASSKSLADLKKIHEAGLSRLHVGLESGCDEVLKYMKKGVTSDGHIKGGKKIVESGISLSEYVMPGLGGKKLSRSHAIETARVLNEIDPAFIRLRSLIIRNGTDLYDRFEAGEFEPVSEDEAVEEIRLFLENLDCNSYLASDQMSNLLWEIEGQLPGDKKALLKILDKYLDKSEEDRMKFRLDRRMKSYLSVYGGLEEGLARKINNAIESMENRSSDMSSKVEDAISALKKGFV
ncbi:MAG: radical SAM protein [Deltaproteobacteria bacterium]|nr:radical SAM protein [Deltaproteobacteria bacterium]